MRIGTADAYGCARRDRGRWHIEAPDTKEKEPPAKCRGSRVVFWIYRISRILRFAIVIAPRLKTTKAEQKWAH